jgi:DNA (cytosine-5)-methyltransferase 1
MPATDICHPEENRPLSIEEYKRLQMFPDGWEICGSISDQYRQIGNAVPVGLGEAVGRAILDHMAGKPKAPPEGFPLSRYKGNDEISWEAATRERLGLSKPTTPQRPQKRNPSLSVPTGTF